MFWSGEYRNLFTGSAGRGLPHRALAARAPPHPGLLHLLVGYVPEGDSADLPGSRENVACGDICPCLAAGQHSAVSSHSYIDLMAESFQSWETDGNLGNIPSAGTEGGACRQRRAGEACEGCRQKEPGCHAFRCRWISIKPQVLFGSLCWYLKHLGMIPYPGVALV